MEHGGCFTVRNRHEELAGCGKNVRLKFRVNILVDVLDVLIRSSELAEVHLPAGIAYGGLYVRRSYGRQMIIRFMKLGCRLCRFTCADRVQFARTHCSNVLIDCVRSAWSGVPLVYVPSWYCSVIHSFNFLAIQ